MELEDLVSLPFPRLQGGTWLHAVSENRKNERRVLAEILIRHGVVIEKVAVLDEIVDLIRDKQPPQWHGMGRVQRQKLFVQEKGLCFVCKQRCMMNGFTVEHKINRADGGTDEWENLTISHKECNQRRAVADNKKREGSYEPIQTPERRD